MGFGLGWWSWGGLRLGLTAEKEGTVDRLIGRRVEGGGGVRTHPQVSGLVIWVNCCDTGLLGEEQFGELRRRVGSFRV